MFIKFEEEKKMLGPKSVICAVAFHMLTLGRFHSEFECMNLITDMSLGRTMLKVILSARSLKQALRSHLCSR